MTDVPGPTSARQAIADGLDYYFVASPPLPPVYTNHEWVPWDEIYGPVPPLRVEVVYSTAQTGSSATSATQDNGSPQGGGPDDYTGAAAQAAPAAPERPPTNPVAGTTGRFGIGWQKYDANGASGFTPPLPIGIPGTQSRVDMEGRGTANPPNFGPLRKADADAQNFGLTLGLADWLAYETEGDDDLKITNLRGNGPFNQVDIAFLVLHGTYGTSMDLTAGGCTQMYFPIASGGSAQYLRMSEMSFGGDGTNGLKWIGLAACNSLYHINWSSMQSQNVFPYTPGLHLMLGCDTKDYTHPALGENWAQFMLGSSTPKQAPLSIRAAWYAGATKTYKTANEPLGVNPIIFAAAGDKACFNDMLQMKTNTVFNGIRFYDTSQVYPPQ
jgi:hypothetical protein